MILFDQTTYNARMVDIYLCAEEHNEDVFAKITLCTIMSSSYSAFQNASEDVTVKYLIVVCNL